ncbi:MAG TPA: thiosulfate oxidation carrier protein SoxY [Ferrovibrio sp.]|jgi:sulfur-oxidizing protein SoxY|uniref:thiosulfate oxidation carrier protein SoxY n=1 Tax=Ferrovibrio sp. TaxID=1917215 RepID=UPI002B4B86DE|nr:thiosulfate oxidation carrier protein SoxY [Ferrovibrio sp.]HLT76694.1 thiosulfate oxidation carrier protein SoxY [Ferrovibrio sp.]
MSPITNLAREGLNRRQAVALGLGGIAAAMAPLNARATPESARKLLSDMVKTEPKAGKVQIKTQEIAENGNTVPVTITVDSPMTDKDYVKAIHVVADRNPLPGVASFSLNPASGKAEVQFRMRMAETQNIIAVAEMSDGSAWTATREVKVTIGGCGG